MKASRFIAGRLRYEGKMAMWTIALSFFIMIVAVCISRGFRKELREGIALISGDISISNSTIDFTGENPLEDASTIMAAVDSVGGVAGVIPAVYRAGIVKSDSEIGGVIFKGVPGGGDSLGVSVPAKLARQTGLSKGDALTAYFIGERVKVRKFRVDSIYEDVMGSSERPVVFAGIGDMRRLNGWTEDEVSAVEVLLEDDWRGYEELEWKNGEIGSILLLSAPDIRTAPVATPATARYPSIFSWLSVIDMNVMVVLLLMTAVAGFNMISGLLILLFRNISTIGLLKSLGMTDASISSVFLRVSSVLVLKGMAIGNAAALLLCAVQNLTHFLKLDPANYYVSFVPMSVSPRLILAADLLSFLAVMVLLLIPCLFVAKVDPAKTVRAQ